MMMGKLLTILGLLLTLTVSSGWALISQDEANNGRFCVRLFVDANGNAAQETGEAPVTQGVSADLRARNSDVILASQLMQDATNRRAGEICFTGLQLGQYEISMNSAIYDIPAGDDMVFTELTETQPVIIANYGVPSPPPALVAITDDDDVDREAVLERSLIAGAGSLIAMALTAFFGLLIYAIFLRQREPDPSIIAPYPPPPMPSDARYRPPNDTGEIDYTYRPPSDR